MVAIYKHAFPDIKGQSRPEVKLWKLFFCRYSYFCLFKQIELTWELNKRNQVYVFILIFIRRESQLYNYKETTFWFVGENDPKRDVLRKEREMATDRVFQEKRTKKIIFSWDGLLWQLKMWSFVWSPLFLRKWKQSELKKRKEEGPGEGATHCRLSESKSANWKFFWNKIRKEVNKVLFHLPKYPWQNFFRLMIQTTTGESVKTW